MGQEFSNIVQNVFEVIGTVGTIIGGAIVAIAETIFTGGALGPLAVPKYLGMLPLSLHHLFESIGNLANDPTRKWWSDEQSVKTLINSTVGLVSPIPGTSLITGQIVDSVGDLIKRSGEQGKHPASIISSSAIIAKHIDAAANPENPSRLLKISDPIYRAMLSSTPGRQGQQLITLSNVAYNFASRQPVSSLQPSTASIQPSA